MSDWFIGSGISYTQYLQTKSHFDDISLAQRDAARETINSIEHATLEVIAGADRSVRQQRDAASETTNAIDRATQDLLGGTDAIATQLGGIESALDSWGASFRWGFAEVLATLGAVADSLEALVRIAKTPAQTAAYEQFEIARDAFRRQLYEECLEALGKAINGDHTSPGYKLEWRFHQLLGVLRLGSFGRDDNLVDAAMAEASFLQAARYARVDDPEGAARALVAAGWAAFVQSKTPEALKHTEGAIALDPRMAEAFFQAGKIRMALGEPEGGLLSLRQAIELEPGYVVKAAGDGGYKRYDREVREFFTVLRAETMRAVRSELEGAMPEVVPWVATSPSVAGHPVYRRWKETLNGMGTMGLVVLLDRRQSFRGDRQALWKVLDDLRSRQDAELAVANKAEALARQQLEAKRRWAEVRIEGLRAYLASVVQRECEYPPYAEWRAALATRADCTSASRALAPNANMAVATAGGSEAEQLLARLKTEYEGIEKGLLSAIKSHDVRGEHARDHAVQALGTASGPRIEQPRPLFQKVREKLWSGLVEMVMSDHARISREASAEIEEWLDRDDVLQGYAKRLVSGWDPEKRRATHG
jgi:tetratricopeptide (TPR) repeat protein